MFSVALKMLNDRDAACDIIQDVFIHYYYQSQNGTDILQPTGWLVRATINKCIDYSKYKNKHTKIENAQPSSINENPIEAKQNLVEIRLALAQLKPKERTLALLYSEGMSYKEISAATGIKFSSVGKTLSRTLKKLNEILKKFDYEMHE